MLVINATYLCKDGMREAFLAAVKAEGIDVASRAEEGNYKYDYYAAVDDPNALLLLEKWRDVDAHALHRTLPHYLRLREFMAEYTNDTLVEKYITD